DAVRRAPPRLAHVGRIRDAEAEAGESRLVVPLVALQFVEAVRRAADGLDGQPRRVVRVERRRPLPREVADRVLDALVLERADCSRERLRELLRVELRRLAAADEQPPADGAAGIRDEE